MEGEGGRPPRTMGMAAVATAPMGAADPAGGGRLTVALVRLGVAPLPLALRGLTSCSHWPLGLP